MKIKGFAALSSLSETGKVIDNQGTHVFHMPKIFASKEFLINTFGASKIVEVEVEIKEIIA